MSSNNVSFIEGYRVLFKSLDKKAFGLALSVLPILAALSIVTFAVSVLPEMIIEKGSEPEYQVLTRKFLDVIWTIVSSVIITVSLAYRLQKPNFKENYSFARQLNQTLIETFRTILRILLYTLLLIVPGIVKMIQLGFVPYVVLLYKPYARGEVDALKASAELTKGHFWLLLSFYIVLQVVFGLVGFYFPIELTKALGWETENLSGMLVLLVGLIGAGVLEAVGILMFMQLFRQVVLNREGENELAI